LVQHIGHTQAWAHKTEKGDRRTDITEFLDWCLACQIDPEKAFRDLVRIRLERSR